MIRFFVGTFDFSLPDWERHVLKTSNSVLEYYSALSFQLTTYNTDMKKARAGFQLKDMFVRFKQKSLGLLDSEALLWNYFAHETTLANILNSLGVYKVIIAQSIRLSELINR